MTSSIETKRKALGKRRNICPICKGNFYDEFDCKHTIEDILNLGVEMARKEFEDKLWKIQSNADINNNLMTIDIDDFEELKQSLSDTKEKRRHDI